MSAGDQVLENIIKGCKAQASKEIKADLKAGKAAAAKIKRLEEKIRKYQKLERNFNNEVRMVKAAEQKKLKVERDLLKKQRAQVRRAARKVARGAACIDKIKKKKMTSFIKDSLDSNWGSWRNRADADAMRATRSIAKQGIKED